MAQTDQGSGRLSGTFLLLSYTTSSLHVGSFRSLVSHLRSYGGGWGGGGVLVRGHSVTGAGECGDDGYQRVQQVIVVKVGVRYDCRLGNCQDRDRPLSSHLPR